MANNYTIHRLKRISALSFRFRLLYTSNNFSFILFRIDHLPTPVGIRIICLNDFARSNLPPVFGEVWCFLTMWEKQKTPQILICRAFGAFWLELNYLIC